MLIAGFWVGPHGALSALLGGLVNVTAGTVFGWVAARSRKATPGEAMVAMMRAETAKIVLIVVQLWIVLVTYREIVLGAFFATFVLAVIFHSMAFFVRER